MEIKADFAFTGGSWQIGKAPLVATRAIVADLKMNVRKARIVPLF
jgi:hypothetical protein